MAIIMSASNFLDQKLAKIPRQVMGVSYFKIVNVVFYMQSGMQQQRQMRQKIPAQIPATVIIANET